MKIALCCIAKCENLYLYEWVNHHLNIGFDHIYIYDNNDTDGERCEDVVGKENPNVTVLKYFIGKKQKGCETQIAAYNDFYQRFGGKYDWVLYLDVDEFLVINDYANVCGYIKDIIKPSTKSVRLNWKCYDDNDNLHYECLPVRERFTRVCEDETLSYYKKHFYRTKLMEFKAINVHYSNIRGDVVDCDGKYATYSTFVTSETYNHNKAYIAHYATKSADEYYMIKKKRRGNGIGNDRLSIEHYFKYNKRTEEKEKYLNDLFSGKIKCNNFKNNQLMYSGNTEKEGLSICISAWKAQDYIEECLNSIYSQTWFAKNENWEVLIGIDCCVDTLRKVKEIMNNYKNLKVYMMEKNVGTYITCNTIMEKASYKWLMRFDSDDIMLPYMVEKVMGCTYGDTNLDVVKYRCITFTKDEILDPNRYAEGSICIKKDLFLEYGGYMPWRCSADSELKKRLKSVLNFFYINEPLYKVRRDNKNSITVDKKTDMLSKYRKLNVDYINTKSESTPKIKFVSDKCEEVNFKKIIVSFTTWKKRDMYVPIVLNNFEKQTKKPDKIICWLSEDEYNGKNIPKTIVDYVNSGKIEVKWIKKNIYCHKRYETFKENNGCINILIDDDILYDIDYVEKLYENSIKYPNSVICYIGNKIKYTKTGREFLKIEDNPSIKNYYLSGMACFPPFVFPKESFSFEKTRDTISTKCDDSWVSAWLLKNNISIYSVYDRKKRWIDIKDAQYCSLWNENKVLVNGVMKKTKTFIDVCKKIDIWKKVSEIFNI